MNKELFAYIKNYNYICAQCFWLFFNSVNKFCMFKSTFSSTSIFKNDFIASGLLFVRNSIEVFNIVNVGEVLSEELQQRDLKSSVLPMVANDVLREFLDKSIIEREDGVKFLVIENLSILFEPELALDVESLFRNYARSLVLTIIDDRPIVNDCYWPFGTDSKIHVDLTGIHYSEVC